MGFSQYDSVEGKFRFSCGRCEEETVFDLAEAKVYSGPKAGLFIQLPPCKCQSLSILFTGAAIGSPGGHALNCLAMAVARRGQFLLLEGLSSKVGIQSQMATIQKWYANDPRIEELEGRAPIQWQSKGAK